jgi:mercuric ion binding protein
MKTTLITLVLFFIGFQLHAQTKAAKTSTITMQTSAQCGDCKERIEGGLNYIKGVKFAELDMASKKVTIRYKTAMTNAENLKKIINGIGYDADDSPADPEAVKKLPLCCQPGGMEGK